jgi:hypothetical protein
MTATSQSQRKKTGARAQRVRQTEPNGKPENGRAHRTNGAAPADSPSAPNAEARLSDEDVEQYVAHLIRGASPAGACLQLGISIRALLRRLAEDADLRQRVQDVQWVLRENVKSAVYRQAMEGNVSAQRCFLQLIGVGDMTPFRQGFDDDDENWESMTPHDMADKYRTAGVVVPEELEALL